MRRTVETLRAATLAVALCGCTSVLGFDDRHVEPHLLCRDGTCVCDVGSAN